MSCEQTGHTIETWRGRDICVDCGIEPARDETSSVKRDMPGAADEHDELCPSAYTFGVCECALIAAARDDERVIRGGEKYVSYCEGREELARVLLGDVEEIVSSLKAVLAGAELRNCGTGEEKYARYVPTAKKNTTFPSDLALRSADLTDNDDLAHLFRACAQEWGPGFADPCDEPLDARSIKITPIGRALLYLIQNHLTGAEHAGEVLSSATATAPAGPGRPATHVPWCRDLDCYGCECLHATTTGGECEDCGAITDLAQHIGAPGPDGLAKHWGLPAHELPRTPAARRALENIHALLHELYPSDEADRWVTTTHPHFPPGAPWDLVRADGEEGLHYLGYYLEELVNARNEFRSNGTPVERTTEEGSELPDDELAALRDAARAAAAAERYALRSCWVCNPAHDHLRTSDCLIECFGCGNYYYRGVCITDTSTNGEPS